MKREIEDGFARLASVASVVTGSFWAFLAALGTIVMWGLLGPIFRYSDDWQLVINTGTTIVTFLMVFVIQHAQNKEMKAVQLKLDELIASSDGASNRLIDVEDLSDAEIDRLARRMHVLGRRMSSLDRGLRASVDDVAENAGP